jgi:gluconokinase
VHLTGSFGLLRERMLARTGHFMAENMLRSQFETLEKPLDALEADVGSSLPPSSPA